MHVRGEPGPGGAWSGAAKSGGAAGSGNRFPRIPDPATEGALDALLAGMLAPGPAGPGPGDAGAASSGRTGVAPGQPPSAPATALLARAVERVSLLVQAGAAPSVTVQLGRSLEVRIDRARDGVAVALHAVHGLSPMAEAELPLLVAALRARGVRVARAGVLSRRDRGPRR